MQERDGKRVDHEPGAAPGDILVLGGAGFIGRHAVQALLDRGRRPLVGSRHPERAGPRLPGATADCPRRRVRLERLLRPEDWASVLDGVAVVVNCVGILRPRWRETYERVHHLAPAALADACAARGIRLLQVSALGLQGPLRSGFLRSKRDGEAALCASDADACLVRPSLLDAAEGGYGARWLRRVAAWPVHPVPADATGRIAALDVRDLGEALARLAERPTLRGDGPVPVFELGGREALPLAGYLAALRRAAGRGPARVLPLPGWLARLGSHVCDLLHATPFSFGHWELLRRDNLPARDDLTALLGRSPRAVGDVADPLGVPAPRPARA